MTTASRRELITKVVEHFVPANPMYGAALSDLYIAMSAARTEWVEKNPGKGMADNTITVHPGDEEIIFRFEVKP